MTGTAIVFPQATPRREVNKVHAVLGSWNRSWEELSPGRLQVTDAIFKAPAMLGELEKKVLQKVTDVDIEFEMYS